MISDGDIVWFAHFTSTPLPSLLDFTEVDFELWYFAAVEQWNKMHPKEG